VTIDDIMADGNKVIARFTARGTHNGEFMSVPPTGKAITLTAIEIFRVKDGKIVELWGEVNMMGLMQQLGMLPGSA
jgi:predicted ester cyclase